MLPSQSGLSSTLPRYPAESPEQLARVLRPEARRRTRWPWIVVGLLGGFAKAQASGSVWRLLFHHPQFAVVVLPILAALALVRAKPLTMALLLSPVVAVLIAPHSVWEGAGIAAAAFVVLVVACLAIGTALRWREQPHSSRR